MGSSSSQVSRKEVSRGAKMIIFVSIREVKLPGHGRKRHESGWINKMQMKGRIEISGIFNWARRQAFTCAPIATENAFMELQGIGSP